VKRFATVLTPMIVLAALAGQARAQPRTSSLSVPSGRAAVNRFAGKTAHLMEEESSFKLIVSEVSGCRKQGADVICLTKWFLPLETCSARLIALPTHPLLVNELGEMTCTEQNNEGLDAPPVPSSTTPGSSTPAEVHVTLRD